MKQRPVPILDVSALPEYGFGSRMTTWWGTLGFCVLEGTGFALAIGTYLYLAFLNPKWPLSAPPLNRSGLHAMRSQRRRIAPSAPSRKR